MSDEYIPGEDCKCSAHCSCECGCGADWTPRRVYLLERELKQADVDTLRALHERNKARKQLDAILLRLGQTQERMINAERALQRIADCDFVITLPDRMDAVREIARQALEKAKGEDDGTHRS
jgi:uncharacterized protein (DUF2461 family)